MYVTLSLLQLTLCRFIYICLERLTFDNNVDWGGRKEMKLCTVDQLTGCKCNKNSSHHYVIFCRCKVKNIKTKQGQGEILTFNKRIRCVTSQLPPNHECWSVTWQLFLKTDALSGRYFKTLLRRQLTGHWINHVTTSSDMECLLLCQRHQQCMSVNYKPGESTGVCELTAVIAEDFPGDLTFSNEFDYYESFV